MMEWAKHLLTGIDNETFDLGRCSWALSMAALFAGAGWNAMHGAALDLMSLAQAIGVVVVAHGGALFLKKDTEPK